MSDIVRCEIRFVRRGEHFGTVCDHCGKSWKSRPRRCPAIADVLAMSRTISDIYNEADERGIEVDQVTNRARKLNALFEEAEAELKRQREDLGKASLYPLPCLDDKPTTA